MVGTLSILALCIPLISALIEDRKGDKHPNNDWIAIGLLMVTMAVVVAIINPNKNFIQALLLSFGIYTLFFPYLANIMFLLTLDVKQDHKWWNRLSETAWPDRVPQWRGLRWYARMAILSIIFFATALVYDCWLCLFTYNGRG